MLTAPQRRLVESNIGLARMVAWRFVRSGAARLDRATGIDDILAIAYMALCEAATRFDPELGFKFSSYAVPAITFTLVKTFRERSNGIRISRCLSPELRPVVVSMDEYTPAVQPAQDAEQLCFKEAIRLLPERQRTAVELRRAGYSQTETARYMGCTQVTVSRYLSKARTELNLALEG